MNEEKQNKTYYQETFHEVHAPQVLAERMRNMNEIKQRKRPEIVAKGLAVAAMAAVILFAGSNVIAYATTGTTWLEQLFADARAKVVIEGDRIYVVDGDIKIDVTEELRENGSASGTYEKNGVTKDYCVTSPDGQIVMTIRYFGIKENEDGQKLSESVFGIAGTPTPTPEE